MSEPDELYTLRNYFWLGSFQRAISEGSGLSRLPEALKVECKEFVYRSYVALGQIDVVLQEISDDPSTPIALQSVKLLARYLTLPAEKELLMSTLEAWLNDPSANSATLQLVAAIVYMYEDKLKEALRAVHAGMNMEHLAMGVQILLRMNRPDLAMKQLKQMQQQDEDATLTQLAAAWVYMAQGSSKLQEAAYIYDELIDKFGSTVLLLNGAAAANIQMGKFPEAERLLLEAVSKGQNDPETLVNLICCYQHMGKPSDLVNRHMMHLKAVAPRHPFVAKLNRIEGSFDRSATAFSTA